MIEAHPFRRINRIEAVLQNVDRDPDPIPAARPTPSPVTVTITGTGSRAISRRFRAIVRPARALRHQFPGMPRRIDKGKNWPPKLCGKRMMRSALR